MRSNKRFSFVIAASLLCAASVAFAQASQTFKADLRIVPIANARGRVTIDESETVFAKANATATLAGTKLTVTGSFQGFKSPASIAQIRTGPALGSRGPVVFDLTVTKETQGSISGAFDLTPEQVTLLRNGRLYVQIHNTNTPEGAVWGWFLK